MKYLKFLKKKTEEKLKPVDIINILKQYEYILVDEGCDVSYNEVADGSIRVRILTKKYFQNNQNVDLNNHYRLNHVKTNKSDIENFKNAPFFEEYIDRIFEDIPINIYFICIMVDEINMVYAIKDGKLVDVDSILSREGGSIIKSK